MSVEPGLLAFTALACLALAMARHRAKVGRAYLSPRGARIAGWSLLPLSAAAAVVTRGPGFGVVTWIGQTSVAAALLVLLMSWRPSATPLAAATALACAPLVAWT